MKKKYQILTAFTILILLTFFAATSWSQIWTGDYTIYDSEDIAALSGYTEVTGTLRIGYPATAAMSTTFENLERLESLTSIGGSLLIYYNDALTSLSGLNNLTSVDRELYIFDNDALVNLCALYNVVLEDELLIKNNLVLSMDTAYALETQLRDNCFTGYSLIFGNTGTVQIFCDMAP